MPEEMVKCDSLEMLGKIVGDRALTPIKAVIVEQSLLHTSIMFA